MRASSSSPSRRAGFTLIELLGVVGIIAILLGIVLSAIETVHRYSRKAVARTEVRTIEDAWRRYLDHYNRWPDTKTGAYLADLSQENVYHTYRMDATLGAALEGRIEEDADAKAINPDGAHFMEFTRYSESADSKTRSPVNPWYRGEKLDAVSSPDADAKNRTARLLYYVRFDVNANNLTSTDKIPGLRGIGTSSTGQANDYATRSVIVWTYNPDAPDEDAIASWRR